MLPPEHKPQTTLLHPALSWTVVSIFLQLYLKPVATISFYRCLFFHVFCRLSIPLCPLDVHFYACYAMRSCTRLNVWPSQFHFFIVVYLYKYIVIIFNAAAWIELITRRRLIALLATWRMDTFLTGSVVAFCGLSSNNLLSAWNKIFQWEIVLKWNCEIILFQQMVPSSNETKFLQEMGGANWLSRA